jgi:hypothetical protein
VQVPAEALVETEELIDAESGEQEWDGQTLATADWN